MLRIIKNNIKFVYILNLIDILTRFKVKLIKITKNSINFEIEKFKWILL